MSLYNITSPLRKYRGTIKIGFLLSATWLLWPFAPFNWTMDPTSGYIDSAIWILVAMSIFCFLGILPLTAWLLKVFWKTFDLPAPTAIISHFNLLQPCQKLQFLFASYALLLLAGVGCLVAIC